MICNRKESSKSYIYDGRYIELHSTKNILYSHCKFVLNLALTYNTISLTLPCYEWSTIRCAQPDEHQPTLSAVDRNKFPVSQ
jgi:hypothetical protein